MNDILYFYTCVSIGILIYHFIIAEANFGYVIRRTVFWPIYTIRWLLVNLIIALQGK